MEDLSIYDFIIYLGILGLILMIFSFLSGMRYIKVKPKLRLHKRLGIVGFLAASVHGFSMLYFYFFS
ncbi:MAG: hypothetical protein IPO21_04105 [Bacteroidales bacterium]|nr:hypothetical protein [Bacteroidales bacterium]